jgi:hypothetical protein
MSGCRMPSARTRLYFASPMNVRARIPDADVWLKNNILVDVELVLFDRRAASDLLPDLRSRTL